MVGGETFPDPQRLRPAAAGGHGLSLAGGAAAFGLRERGLCPAAGRHADCAELDELVENVPPPGHALGRGQGPPRHPRHASFRGQQQRLTLARALSHRPEILCLDEFSIAIDPVTTMKIEDMLRE